MQTEVMMEKTRLVSVSLPCPNVNLMTFLNLAQGTQRFFWSGDGLELAASGVVTQLVAWGTERFTHIGRRAEKLFDGFVMFSDSQEKTHPRLFGGFSFRPDFTPDNTWSIYAPAMFVLPHYQFVKSDGETWLTLNTQIPLKDDPNALIDDLRAALTEKIGQLQNVKSYPDKTTLNSVQEINYPMSYEQWCTNVRTVVDRICSGEFNKVVLARVCEAQFAQPLNVLHSLAYLEQHYQECYRFLFEPRPHYAFFGATPELLAQVQGDALATMGLAGSIRRGSTPEEDAALAHELMTSQKDRHEQQLVVDRIREQLEPLAHTLAVADVQISALSNIQHLHTLIKATLKHPNGILPMVQRLHPTPALGGDPYEVAMEVIPEYEPVPRGWYASPVGWIGPNLDGEFAVAIRSAVVQERRVWMYAGAGIVADSVPEKEWDETALKFQPMLRSVGVG